MGSPPLSASRLKSVQRPARFYMVSGRAATPTNPKQSNHIDSYRLAIFRSTPKHIDDPVIELRFGEGNYRGGYICFIGSEIDSFTTTLDTLSPSESHTLSQPGRVLTNQDTDPKPLSPSFSDRETYIPLQVTGVEIRQQLGAQMQLGETNAVGADATFTAPQLADLIGSIRRLRHMPTEEFLTTHDLCYIGPDGDSYWSS